MGVTHIHVHLEERNDDHQLLDYFVQEAVAVTTAIQEEILIEMGIGGLILCTVYLYMGSMFFHLSLHVVLCLVNS